MSVVEVQDSSDIVRMARRTRHLPPQFVAPEAFSICATARYQRRAGPGRAAFPTPMSRIDRSSMPTPAGEGWWWR